MDIRQYFRKLREIEASITDEYPVIMSLETSDGGKPGVTSEVSRFVAAKMMVEGRARLASEAEVSRYGAHQAAVKEAFEAAELAKTVQVAIVDRQALSQVREGKRNPPSGTGK
jgi:hypothetical protein